MRVIFPILGTVENITFINMTNGEVQVIETVQVPDEFNCKDFRFSIQFPDVS